MLFFSGPAETVEDSEEGPRGPPPPLFLDQTEARRAEKNFFLRPPTPLPHSVILEL